jgi:integrase/recombinase XerD
MSDFIVNNSISLHYLGTNNMKQAKILTVDETKRVLAVIDANRHAERNRAVFFLSHLAGLRACEIASLRLIDVVDDNWVAKSQVVLEKNMTKGNERHRVLISTKLRKHLQRYVDSTCLNCSITDPFIRSQKGSSFSPMTIVQLFGRLFAKSGIKGASSHSGRRSFITALDTQGVSVRVIQALARHSDLSLTQRYIDVSDSRLENAVELL